MEAVIFDCDGVLVNSEPIYAQAFSNTLREFGYHVDATLLRTSLRGKSMPDCYKWLNTHYSFSATDTFNEALLLASEQLLSTRLQSVEGAKEVVKSVVLPKAVASNGLKATVTENIKRCGFDGFFNEHIYTAEMVSYPKPAPDLYVYAAKKMGVKASHCCVIEDSPLGVQAARAAGMKVCFLTHGEFDIGDASFNNILGDQAVGVALTMRDVEQWLILHGAIK